MKAQLGGHLGKRYLLSSMPFLRHGECGHLLYLSEAAEVCIGSTFLHLH